MAIPTCPSIQFDGEGRTTPLPRRRDDQPGRRQAAMPTGRLRLRFAAGVVPCDRKASASFGDRLFAMPVPTLWETT